MAAFSLDWKGIKATRRTAICNGAFLATAALGLRSATWQLPALLSGNLLERQHDWTVPQVNMPRAGCQCEAPPGAMLAPSKPHGSVTSLLPLCHPPCSLAASSVSPRHRQTDLSPWHTQHAPKDLGAELHIAQVPQGFLAAAALQKRCECEDVANLKEMKQNSLNTAREAFLHRIMHA